MSTTVDGRVVEMRFDNKNFESNVQTSMSTLEKLKHALKLDGASKGLESVSNSAKKVTLAPISSAVDTVNAKFSALGVMGVTALANITNSAVNAGKRMVSALTIDPIKSGFEEYELKMNSIQTIMSNTASKGETMSSVTKVLDELNTYADKTIYNFAEMTRNIGTFTAAGVGLEDSAKAIQGIANLAAASGSSSQQASTAMYQLSQALAAGTVKLQDWNSVVNAGMGGEKFQEALKQTARESGIAIDQIIADAGSFRDSLQKGWMTADVLNDTLKKFTVEGAAEYADAMLASGQYTEAQAEALKKEAQAMEDAATKVKTFTQLWDTLQEAAQSGWSQSWEYIVGNFEQAKILFTELSDFFGDIINNSANRRNSILEGALSSKWDDFIKKVNEAGMETDTFKEKLNSVLSENNQSVDGLVGKYGSLERAIHAGALSTDDIKKALVGVSNTVLDIEGVFKRGSTGEEVVKIQEALEQAGFTLSEFGPDGKYGSETEKMVKQFQEAKGLLADGIVGPDTIAALEQAGTTTYDLTESVDGLVDGLTELSGREMVIESFRNAWHGVSQIFGTIGNAWKEVFPPKSIDERVQQLSGMIKTVYEFSKGLKLSGDDAVKLGQTFKGLFDILKVVTTFTSGAFGIGIKAVSALLKAFDMNILDVTSKIGLACTKFKEWVFNNELVTKSFEKLAVAIPKAVTTAKNWFNEFKNLPAVQKNLDRLGNFFTKTFESLKTKFLEGFKLDDFNFDKVTKNAASFRDKITSYLSSVGVGFNALKVIISDAKDRVVEYLDKTGLSFDNFKTKLGDFASYIKEHVNLGELFTYALGVGSILAIIKVWKTVSTLMQSITGVFDNVSKMLEGVTGVLKGFEGVLSSVSKVMKAAAMQIKAKAIKDIAEAIAILAGSLALLTLLDQGKLEHSAIVLASLAGVLGVLYAVLGVVNKFGGKGNAKGLISISASLLILVGALKGLENLDGTTLDKNLAILAGMAIGLGAIATIMSKIAPELSKGSKILIAFAISLRLMVDSLALLTLLNQDKLTNSVITLGSLAGILGILYTVLGIVNKFGGVGNSKALLSISASLVILVGTLKAMEKLDPNTLNRNLAILAGMAVGLGAVAAIMGRISPQLSKGSGFLIAFAVSLRLMVESIKALAKIQNVDVNQTIVLLTAAVTGLAAISRLCGSVKVTSAVGLIGTVLALKALISVIEDITKIDVNAIRSSLSSFLVVFGMLAGLMLSSKLAGKNAASAGVMILAISLAMGNIVKFFEGLADVNPSSIEKGIKVIGAMSVIFGLVTALSKFAGKYAVSAGAMLLLMSGAIGILALTIGYLSTLDEAAVQNGAKVIAALEVVFGGLIAVTHLAKNCVSTIAVLTAAVAVLALAVAGLSMLEPEKLKPATEALSILMGMFALMVASTGLVQKVNSTLIILVVVVGLLAGILAALAYLDVEPSIETAGALSVLLLAMSAACLVLSKCGSVSASALGALAVVTLVVAGIGAVLGLMAHFNVEPSIETAGALSILLLSMSATCLILSAVGPMAGMAISGAIALVGVITVIGAFMLAVGALVEKFPKVQEFVNKGIPLLSSITEGLGKIAGSFVGGLFEGMSPAADILVDFFTKMGGIDSGQITAVANAAKGLADLENSLPSTGGKLQEWFGEKTTLDTFGKQLVKFGVGLKAFSIAINGINTDAIAQSATAAQGLADLESSLPRKGGKLQEWFGEQTTLDVFGKQLIAFGVGLKAFSIAINGINTDAIAQSATAAQGLANLENSLPSTGGKLQEWFFGEQTSLDEFGKQLVTFGIGLKLYSFAVSGLDTDAIAQSATAAQGLADLANALPSKSGKFQEWFGGGKDTLSGFGENLREFGTALSDYSDSVVGVNTDSMSKALTAITSLSDFSIGIADAKFDSLSDFGYNMQSFGGYILSYYSTISSVESEKISALTTELQSLVTFLSSIGSVSSNAVSSFGEALKSIGDAGIEKLTSAFTDGTAKATESVNTLFTSISSTASSNQEPVSTTFNNTMKAGIDKLISVLTDGTTKATTNAKTLFTQIISAASSNQGPVSTAFNNTMKAGIDKLISVLTDGTTKATTNTKTLFTQIVSTASGSQEPVSTAFNNTVKAGVDKLDSTLKDGKEKATTSTNAIFTGIAQAASDNGGPITSTFNSVLSSALSSAVANIWSYYASFYNAGAYVVAGFASGISANAFQAAAAASAMASQALSAAKAALAIHSPSKEFEKLGKYSVEGFVAGIESEQGILSEAIMETFEDVIKQVRGSLDFGKSTFSTFVKSYDEVLKTIGGSEKVLKIAAKAISAYGKQLYEESDQYKKDNDAIKEHKKELQSLEAEREKLNAKYAEARKKHTKEGEKQAKDLKKQLEKNEKSIKEAKKQIEQDEKDVVTHTKEAFNECRKSLSDSVSGFIDPFKVSIETGIDLLKASAETGIDLLKASAETGIDLFKEFGKESELTADQVIANMQSQVDGVSKWQSDLDELAAKGVGEGLLEKLKDMGPSSAEYVNAFMTMTAEQIVQANDLFAESMKMSADTMVNNMQAEVDSIAKWQADLDALAAKGVGKGLIDQMKEMGQSSSEQIKTFMAMSSEQIAQVNKLFAESVKMSGDVMLGNMEEQIHAVEKWQKDLNALAKKGLGQGLIEQLKEMGPASAEQIKTFMSMTNDQIAQANKLFEESMHKSSEAMIKNWKETISAAKNWAKEMEELRKKGLNQDLLESLGNMGLSGEEYIKTFLTMSEKQIEQLNKMQLQSLKLPDKIADQIMLTYSLAGEKSGKTYGDALTKQLSNEVSEGMGEGIQNGLKKATPTISKSVEEVINVSLKAAKEKTTAFKDTVGVSITKEIANGVGDASAVAELKTSSTGVFDGILGTFDSYENQFYDVGRNISDGIASGISSGASKAISAAISVASSALEAAKTELEINSPSKKFAELGRYADEGMALGFKKNTDVVEDEAAAVGKSAFDSMAATISKISDIINSDIDVAPTIRPVIDLTDFSIGTKRMDAMLSKTQAVHINSSISRRATNNNQNGVPDDIKSTGNTINYTQNNYSPKALSRVDIYRQTKNQLSAMKEVLA